ncbi:hypothetical protein [Variovorax paradoxus]|uniref:hypothetical protein n=1 Tax=Variovorax paradoxus TaxID=34073 RepID=UPI0005A5302C|nr:hypothetical protein [Variovorax paradoxus]
MNVTKIDLFEDIAVSMEFWTKSASKALTDRHANLGWVEEEEPYKKIQEALMDSGVNELDVAKVFSELFRGFAVSFLTALDGGTALAEKGRIYVVDENDVRLGEGLHQDFVGHLLDTGRL